MANFRLLSRTQQTTDYTCGPAALQAVLRYFGKDVAELELARLAGTNDAVGTFPEGLAAAARAVGFAAEVRENLTLDEVEAFTAGGQPMIALAQVWRSRSDAEARPLADNWDNGHYIVVLGVDRDNVYFQDPWVLMSKGFTPRSTFESHWQQIMGGAASGNRKLMRVGILVSGDAPLTQAGAIPGRGGTIDESRLGTLNLITLKFDGVLLPFDLMMELREIWDTGMIRPNAFIFLRKDADGLLSGMEGSRILDEDEVTLANALVAAVASGSMAAPAQARSKVDAAVEAAAAGDFGLSMADIRTLAADLKPNQSAVIGIFENLWERRLGEIVARHGGVMAAQRTVPRQTVAAAAARIAAASA
jgi:predicted double-glycine peptidase